MHCTYNGLIKLVFKHVIENSCQGHQWTSSPSVPVQNHCWTRYIICFRIHEKRKVKSMLWKWHWIVNFIWEDVDIRNNCSWESKWLFGLSSQWKQEIMRAYYRHQHNQKVQIYFILKHPSLFIYFNFEMLLRKINTVRMFYIKVHINCVR